MIPKWCENIRRVHVTRVKRKFCECVFSINGWGGKEKWRGGAWNTGCFKNGGQIFFFNKKREGNSIGYLGIFWEKRESNVECSECTGCFKNGWSNFEEIIICTKRWLWNLDIGWGKVSMQIYIKIGKIVGIYYLFSGWRHGDFRNAGNSKIRNPSFRRSSFVRFI